MIQIFDAISFFIESVWATIKVIVSGLKYILLVIPSGLARINLLTSYLSTTEDSLLFYVFSAFVSVIIVTSLIRLVVSFIP